jgi:hypothetical protein
LSELLFYSAIDIKELRKADEGTVRTMMTAAQEDYIRNDKIARLKVELLERAWIDLQYKKHPDGDYRQTLAPNVTWRTKAMIQAGVGNTYRFGLWNEDGTLRQF